LKKENYETMSDEGLDRLLPTKKKGLGLIILTMSFHSSNTNLV